MSKERITVRLTANQMLVLEELKNVLNCNISLMIRMIVGKFLTDYEDYIYDIIDGKRDFNPDWINNAEEIEEENADNQ